MIETHTEQHVSSLNAVLPADMPKIVSGFVEHTRHRATVRGCVCVSVETLAFATGDKCVTQTWADAETGKIAF